MNLHRAAPKRRQIQELRLLGMNDLDQDYVGCIRELQIEIVKLRDVRGIYPEVVLLAYPLAERFALHGLGADIKRNFRQELFGQVKVLKSVLPALLIGTLG